MTRRGGMSTATFAPGFFMRLTVGLPRPFWALVAGTFLTRAATFVVPLLFVYLTQERKLSLPLAGTISALYGAGALGGTTLGGVCADRVGRRFTMLASLFGAVVTLLLLANAWEPAAIALAVFSLGFFSDAFRPASQALVADLIPPEHRLKAFSLQYWALNLGFSCAAIVGGYMARRNFTVLFYAEAACLLLLAVIVWFLIRETRPAPANQTETAHTSLAAPYFDRKFAPFLLLNLAIAIPFFFHLSALPDDMQHKGLTTEDFGLAVATNGVLIVLLQPLLTGFIARRRPAQVLAAASALTGLGFGLNAWAHSTPAFMACVALWTVAEILFAPVNSTLVAQLSPAGARGRYQGAFTLTWSAAAMLAPIIASQLIPAIGHSALWGLCLLGGLTVAVAHLTVSARTLPKSL